MTHTLTTTPEELPVIPDNSDQTNLRAYITYNLTTVEALVQYFHAAAGFPVRATWLKAINMGNDRTWPGITLDNATA